MKKYESNAHPGARFLLMSASAIIVIGGLKIAGSLLVPFLLAAFLSVLCLPEVAWLTRHRVPTVVAVLVVVVVLGALLSGFGAIVGGSVNRFTAAAPKYEERVDQLWVSVQGWIEEQPLDLLPFSLPAGGDAEPLDVIKPGQVMSFLGTSLKGVLAALQNTFLVILTLVFMLLEATTFPSKVNLAFGEDPGNVGRFAEVTAQVQRYLAIKTVTSVATGVTIGFWVGLLGLDFAVVWGLVAFLLNYIPNIGSVVAAVPAVLFAFVQLGLGPGLAVAGGFLLVNLIVGNIVEPALLGRTLGLSTLVVFLSLVFWGWMWGTVGMLLSVPLTMILKILLENSEDLRWVAVLLDSGRGIDARMAEIRAAEEAEAEAAADGAA